MASSRGCSAKPRAAPSPAYTSISSERAALLLMTAEQSAPVAIIGGGFSGTMTAANLARRGIGSILIEANGRAGLGAAYSTDDPAHLLNIPAETMGAWADDPGDFAKKSGAPSGS